ncbi:2-hydroxyacid dehydrogenase [Sulfolobus acidocaldarius SUSAZ]|nr:2-hydroxyacid dehydrogenase [Sulfolobus acidocaldarius SUSAZ]
MLNVNSPKVKELESEIRKLADIIILDPYDNEEKWAESCEGVIAIVDRKARITKKIMSSCSDLKLIARTGVGVDETRVDLAEAKRRGIAITYNPGVNSPSVAEFTFTLILSLYKRIFKITNLVKEGEWAKGQNIFTYELFNKTLGIIGLGNIGRRVARIGKAFEMEVLGYDLYIKKSDEGIRLTDLSTLLKESDIVTIHVPLTQETKNLIGEEQIRLMKPNAIIINTSRGGIIDEEALLKALKEKRIAGAGLDVLALEPPNPNNPLFSLDNVIITPHVAGVTHEAAERGFIGALTQVLNLLQGKPLTNVFPL